MDANGNGLSRLWLQQIMQFPNVGLDPAGAIISVYSSPKALVRVSNAHNLTTLDV